MDKFLKNLIIALILFGGVIYVSAAPVSLIERSIIPETDNVYYIGTSTPSNLRYNGIFNNLTVSGTCTGCGTGSQTPWTGNIDGAGFNLTNAGTITGRVLNATSTTGVNYFMTNVGIGTTTPTNALDIVGLQALGSQYNNIAGNRFQFQTARYRGTSAIPLTVADQDLVGAYAFRAYDGTTLQQGAMIQAIVDGTVTTGNVPMRLGLFAGGSASDRTEYLSIKPTNGFVGLGTTSPYAKLSVAGDVVGATFTATTTGVNTFPFASTTALSGTSLCISTDCRSSWASTQTPWAQSIDGAGFNLTNAGIITGTALNATSTTATSTLSGGLVVNTNTFVVDNAQSRVGIGTLPAFRQLTLTGATLLSTNASSFGNTTCAQVLCVHGATGTLNAGVMFVMSNFRVANTERWRIQADGSIGHGTSTPQWQYDLASTTPQFTFTDTDAGVNQKHYTFQNNNGIFTIATSSDTVFTSQSNAILGIQQGNVGIGTSSPTANLVLYNGAATTTMYCASANGSGKGCDTIWKDINGTTCTELYTLAGVLTAKAVTCPF